MGAESRSGNASSAICLIRQPHAGRPGGFTLPNSPKGMRRMTLQVSQAVITAGITPTALTPAASDTIAAGSFGSDGIYARVITSGTATNVTVLDPNNTVLGNPGTATLVACPATGVRMIYIPVAAINQATGVATVTFSGTLTGVTYELYRA